MYGGVHNNHISIMTSVSIITVLEVYSPIHYRWEFRNQTRIKIKERVHIVFDNIIYSKQSNTTNNYNI